MKMCSFLDLESFFKASFAVVAVKIVYSTKLSAFREATSIPDPFEKGSPITALITLL